MAWWHHSLPAVTAYQTGVAVLGGRRVDPIATLQLVPVAFQADGSPLDGDLARLFSERQLAVDIRVGQDRMLRVGAFGAPPASGKARDGTKIGERKPWFHHTVAHWISTWPFPHLFAMDANTPRKEGLQWTETKFWWWPGRTGANEGVLLGEEPVHGAHDLWREWLDSPDGKADRADVPEGGPLARSYTTAGERGWKRYDHIWASDGIRAVEMKYVYDKTVSDHALVTASIHVP